MSYNRLYRRPKSVITLLALLGLILLLPLAAAAQAPVDEVDAALRYIHSQQTPEGGIDAFGSGADPSTSARVVLATAACHRAIDFLRHAETGLTPLDYLADAAIDYTHAAPETDSAHLFPGNAGLLLAAVAAAGKDPKAFGGMDLIAELEDTLDASSGAFRTSATEGFTTGEAIAPNQAWAMLGLAAAGRPVAAEAASYLTGLQEPSGAWYDGDPDTTGLAVVALITSGHAAPTDAAIQQALAFFRDTQRPGGGWRPDWDTDELNVDSTGWIIQALLSMGHTQALETWRRAERPTAALAAMQQADGSIGGSYANAFGTAEALFGLCDQPLFILGREIRTLRALSWLAELQEEDGGWGMPGIAVDVALAFAGAGYDVRTVTAGETSAMDYIESAAADYTGATVDQAGKLAVLLAVTGDDPRTFGRVDTLAAIEAAYDPAVSAFGTITNTYHQAFALLGLAAHDQEMPVGAPGALVGLQQEDGGWKYDLQDADWNMTTADNTAIALQALLAAGIPETDPAIAGGIAFLQATQDALGGWDNANATAFAIQALEAAGETMDDWMTPQGHTPLTALAQYQKMDGPFVWMWDSPWGPPADNLLATAQAIPALWQRPLPLTEGTPTPFENVHRGPDPDRLLPGRLRVAMQEDGLAVMLPFDGDLDADAQLWLEWITPGRTAWTPAGEMARDEGLYRAILPLERLDVYLLRIIATDSEGIQTASRVHPSAVMVAAVPPTVWGPTWFHRPGTVGVEALSVVYW